jgi:hypothetical protein
LKPSSHGVFFFKVGDPYMTGLTPGEQLYLATAHGPRFAKVTWIDAEEGSFEVEYLEQIDERINEEDGA